MQTLEHRDTQLTRLLRSAKNATPEGLRSVLRPVVRAVVPEEVRANVHEPPASPRGLLACDRYVDNHYTINDGGTLRRFFFLCGCFKSGTNWVQNLLNLHPHASVRGEFHFEVLRNAVDQLTNVYWFLGSKPRLREVAMDGSEAMVRRMVYASTRDKPGATWLGDRTPNPLRTVIRGAPQIIITRDVRDVLVSWSFHHMRVDTEMGIAVPFRECWAEARPRFLEDPQGFNPLDGLLGHEGWVRHHANHWAHICRASREARPKLEEEGTPVLELKYEQLHADLDGEVERLYRFLGLDPSLAEAPSERTKTRPGFGREDRKSFYRKGAVGEWEDVLPENIRGIIKECAGEEMIAAGYAEDLDW